jgi:biotin operon repressor
MGASEENDASRLLREELDDHLTAINENTTEIAAVQECVNELDARMDKLAERLDMMHAILHSAWPATLSVREETVFSALVAADCALSSARLSADTGISQDAVAQSLLLLQQRGVPIIVRADDVVEEYELEASFHAAHASWQPTQPIQSIRRNSL